jgi:hypothetical protein
VRPRRRIALRFSFIYGLFVVGLCWSPQAAPQQKAPVYGGVWTATAGTEQALRGTWSAQTSPNSPNAAQGSWTLLSEANEVVLQGTWSARKTDNAWQGTWTARTSSGGSFSGTWYADLRNFNGKTMEEMLKRTVETQVAGSWRSGQHQGNWWIEASGAKVGHR